MSPTRFMLAILTAAVAGSAAKELLTTPTPAATRLPPPQRSMAAEPRPEPTPIDLSGAMP